MITTIINTLDINTPEGASAHSLQVRLKNGLDLRKGCCTLKDFILASLPVVDMSKWVPSDEYKQLEKTFDIHDKITDKILEFPHVMDKYNVPTFENDIITDLWDREVGKQNEAANQLRTLKKREQGLYLEKCEGVLKLSSAGHEYHSRSRAALCLHDEFERCGMHPAVSTFSQYFLDLVSRGLIQYENIEFKNESLYKSYYFRLAK